MRRPAGTLETVRARGHLVCGVGDGPKGYSTLTGEGAWTGISVDFCKALAAAVLGGKHAVKFRPVSPSERSRRCSRARSMCCPATSP